MILKNCGQGFSGNISFRVPLHKTIFFTKFIYATLKIKHSIDLQQTYQNGQIIDAREGSLKTNLSKVLLTVMKGVIKFIKGFGQKTTKKVCKFFKWFQRFKKKFESLIVFIVNDNMV